MTTTRTRSFEALCLALLMTACGGAQTRTPETVIADQAGPGDDGQAPAPGAASGAASGAAGQRGASTATSPGSGDAGLPWLSATPVRGPADAPITILAFSDYQCPFCMRGMANVSALLARHSDVQFVYLHRPLAFHAMAMPAARAAAAANRQGKFWQMHDAMIAVGARISEDDLVRIAAEIGLDVERWRLERDDPGVIAEVDQHGRIADIVNARGTPTFFVNGERIVGAQAPDVFEAAIERARGRIADGRAQGLSGAALRESTWTVVEPEAGKRLLGHAVHGHPVTDAEAANAASATAPRRTPAERPDEVWNVPVDPKRDPVLGDSDRAEVTWVVFSDLQCPFCRRLHQSVSTLQSEYGDRLRVVWKSLPLPFHPQARDAQIAAYAAGRQGAYWPYIQRCFGLDGDNTSISVSNEALDDHAKALKLNMRRFALDRKDAALAAQVNANMELASKLGVRGTPTNFLNGRKVSGAQPVEVLRKNIDELLAATNGRKGQAAYEAVVGAGRSEADPR